MKHHKKVSAAHLGKKGRSRKAKGRKRHSKKTTVKA